MERVHIASLAVVTPPCRLEQCESERLVQQYYKGKLNSRSLSLIRTLFSHPSIRCRNFAVDHPGVLVDEDLDARMARFTHWSVELSSNAVLKALDKAGLGLDDVGALVVNTCTGYICPGISTYLIEKLGLPGRVRVYDLVGSGCGGAIPNLEVSASLLQSNGHAAVVSVSVEICTATFQMDNDLSLLLSNTLFGDGASAAVLWTRQEGLALVSSASRYVPEQRETIRYVHKKGQLHNQLSLRLPELIGRASSQVVSDVLAPRGLSPGDIRHWAVHSGGEKIINAVKDALGLSEEQVAAARKVLLEHGNMSSPTVWFVLHELEQAVSNGDWCVMLAFGAGLSAHAYLLKKK